ncbi:hypothetical protein [Gephyromycinifex aptenodytis]|uniref:hypothetical protein n=1 Tax=Gephyromycinifex aptenodytis TaxID=2716227 RepID=UPI001445427C|nr:hypothetical protein [Gephyromycinifex aptenodytis]
MSVAGVEGTDPVRGSATAAATGAPAGPVAPTATSATGGGRNPNPIPPEGFHSPELTSGLLSEHVEPWQREELGRLGRMLRMQPRDILDTLRSGRDLGFLLAARRLSSWVLHGQFDKGLLIDAQA